MTRVAPLAFALLLAPGAARAASPRPLRASLPPEAKAAYLEGRALFEDGDAAGALVKFDEAYALARDPRLLWNEAVCEKSLRHYASVRALIARYLEGGGALLTADDRAEARELAAAIEPFTTALTITSTQAGADVAVDGDPAGTTPLAAPVVVDIGAHVVTVAKAGFRTWSERITVGERRAEAIEAALLPAGGSLDVHAPAGAEVAIDGAVVGRGELSVPLSVGGHAVRVTAPGFLPYESDVVVEDATRRRLDVTLVRDARDPRSAELRVAVGCGDPDPRVPVEGLSVTVDGSVTNAVDAVNGFDDAEGKPVVDFVRYRVAPGKHVVRVAIPECVPSETRVVADDDEPALVRGSLARERRELLRGPAGTPDGWRVAVSGLVNVVPGTLDGVSVGPAIGAMGSAGVTTRWFVASAELGFASGDATYQGESRSETEVTARLRVGLRAPFDLVAVSAGVGLGLYTFSGGLATSEGVVPLWLAVDVHALCEWALPVGFTWSSAAESEILGFEIGLAFQPNHRCRREVDTVHGL